MSHIRYAFLGALTLGLLGSIGCSSADAVDGDSNAAAAASEGTSNAKETSVKLEKAGDSFTFNLENVDTKRTMILTIRGTGAFPIELCTSPYHPSKGNEAEVANVKIEYDGLTKYSDCEVNILFDKSTKVKVTSMADWNDAHGNLLTVTLREAVVGDLVDLYRWPGEAFTGRLCRVADGCASKQTCRSALQLLTISGPIKPDGFGQDYGFCTAE